MTALECDVGVSWTDEQRFAIERREGELLLDAAAGSGKTSVLVERFVRSVLEDGVEVSAILTITFTEKAAAELRDRIRRRLRELGADEAARDTEGAFISTIHGFCARVLRAGALSAGIDPGFAVLDGPDAQRLADGAFDEALEQLAAEDRGTTVELIASYTPGVLRGAILSSHAELRSRGATESRLPPLPPAPDLETARAALLDAAARASAELGAVAGPSAKVIQALERLAGSSSLLAQTEPWPGELARIALPGGNGAALSTPVCTAYSEALTRFRTACEHRCVQQVYGVLDRLLMAYAHCYERRKRERSALDFEDLELLARDLLRRDGELRDRYRARFAHVMVDELQDTNAVQLELIELVASGNLFAVGDAQQSIYGFRHADVELFERLGARLERAGARARLRTNFRSRPEILAAVNAAFAQIFGERFMALEAGREDQPDDSPRVELLVIDKAGDWESDGLGSPWRIAEARALARRVCVLVSSGCSPREVVVLTRATTDLRVYERALEERGIPTYVIGGRGYWGHPQVVDVVAYLRALANPRDEDALYTVLASPLLGISVDALVLLAAAARAAGRDPWWVLREPPPDALQELSAHDRELLARFAAWFEPERRAAVRLGVDELIDRALQRSGYDLTMLAMPGGRRRLANVRKLMRLGREHEAAAGRDLGAFLELVRGRAAGWAGFGDERESEAPVEGEALDAVRLMTIHRAKGLEFPVVCVADLGRMPWRRAELLRIGRDGRVGLRLGAPGTGKAEPVLDYKALGDEQLEAERREDRRLFYVAVTRAQERLIVSGAAKLESWGREATPMGWLGPALADAGITPRFISEDDEQADGAPYAAGDGPTAPTAQFAALSPPPAASPAPPVGRLSYSALGEYQRCGYRFYVERVLLLPSLDERRGSASGEGGLPAAERGLPAAERGIIVHALLEKLDFRRPLTPTVEAVFQAAGRRVEPAKAEGIAALIASFGGSPLCARLAAAAEVRREERFAFALDGGVLIAGALDVLAREGDGRMLVVDYKSDRLDGSDPVAVVSAQYDTQRLVYALAALRAGAAEVELAHVFLEAAEHPVTASFTAADTGALEARLRALAGGVQRREFLVAEEPHRALCEGCPAEGGLCSWPTSMTRREAPDRLF